MSYRIRNGFQLRSDRTTTSRVVVHAEDSTGLNTGKLYENTTAILSTGNFSSTELWTDAEGAGRGRFAPNAYGMTYCNGVESCIYSGDESFVPACFQFKTIDTELMPNQVDRDFSGASAWANVDIDSYDETGDLSLTATAGDQYCTLPTASAPMESGKWYALRVKVSNLTGSWEIWDYAGNQLLVTISEAGTLIRMLRPTSSGGGGFRIVAAGTDSSADFDDFSLKEVSLVEVTKAINNTLQTDGNYITINDATNGAPAMLIMSDRALKGIKLYVKSANTTTSTIRASYHSTSSWKGVSSTSDGTASGGKALAQTGSVTFDSTVSDAVPYYVNGLYLYAYYLELQGVGASAEVYYMTLDAPFQVMKDIWDGVFRVPVSFQYNNGTTYSNFTYDVNYESPASTVVGAIIDEMTTSGEIYMAFEERMAAVLIKMFAGYVNTNSSLLSLYYWNGVGWSEASVYAEETSNSGKCFGKTGAIAWMTPTDEESTEMFNMSGYHYKMVVSATLSGTADGDAEVVIDTVQGIPAQQDIIPAKFCSEYLGRALLCGYTAGKEGNRIDYSMADAPLCFNGDESSRNNSQSIYVSGSDDLEAAITLTNRYGASIIGVHVLLKRFETHILFGTGPSDFKIYPISYNVGCIAPLSVFTAEVAFGVGSGDEAKRNISGWLSHDGPVFFDGTVLIPISGIRKFFDPADDEYINLDYVDRAVSYYNSTEKVWNLLIPTGSSTTLNTWLCFDMVRPQKGWFEKVPPNYPQAAWPVIDTNGVRHIYGGLDSGYMVQLDYGTSWAGTSITHVLETGDFGPSGNIFDKTCISEVRAVAKRTTEDADLTISHYADTSTSSTSIGTVALDSSGSSNRLIRDTIDNNKVGWLHRFRFSAATDSTDNGLQLIGWAFKWHPHTEDPK